MTEKSPPEDYIFRYPLRLEPASNAIYPNAVTEMIRAQLQCLLNLVIPVAGGKEVKIDGFKLLRDRDKVYDIFGKKCDGDRSVTHSPDPLTRVIISALPSALIRAYLPFIPDPVWPFSKHMYLQR